MFLFRIWGMNVKFLRLTLPNFMKILSAVVGGGIAIGFLMLLYTLIVNPDKAKKTMSVVTQGALLATPQGRAISATGVGSKQITG